MNTLDQYILEVSLIFFMPSLEGKEKKNIFEKGVTVSNPYLFLKGVGAWAEGENRLKEVLHPEQSPTWVLTSQL